MDLNPIIQILTVISLLIAIIGIPVGVYKFYVKDQQTDGEKTDKVKDKANDLATRIEVLETKLMGEIKNLGTSLGGDIKILTAEFTNIKLNHLHTIETKQIDQDSQLGKHTVAIEKLATIIDERVPRKTVDHVT